MRRQFPAVGEVTRVSRYGFWLRLGDEELLVRFDDFPWFREATIAQIESVEWPTPNHLYWPELDSTSRSARSAIRRHFR